MNHEVTVEGAVASATALPMSGSDTGSTPLDVSHLRPMSEGVLKAAGLHGGVDEHGAVRDLRGKLAGAVDLDPTTLPSDELHVQKMRLEHQTQGMVERHSNANGSITLRLIHGDGDVTSATGEHTHEALAKLIEKMGGLK